MSTAELRDAAKRLRKLHDGEGTQEWADDYCNEQAGLDERTVVSHILATTADDDEEPVTREWLESVGFESEGVEMDLMVREWPAHAETTHRIGVLFWPEKGGGIWSVNGVRFPTDYQLPTRGEVRRVLVALGVGR